MLFYHASFTDQLIAFILAINLPSVVIYLIPYSEALFLFTAVIGFYGIIKKRPLLYFLGFMLMAMVRPATLFVALSIISAEVCLLFYHKKASTFIKNMGSKLSPFLVGYLLVLLIQYYYSGSFSTYLDAQKYWAGSIQPITGISDWSVESFALSSFAIFGICLPAAIVFMYLFLGKGELSALFKQNLLTNTRSYLLLISIFYLVGLLLFTLITSGGNLHSFYRFTLVSPFFYVGIFLCFDYFTSANNTSIIKWIYALCIASLVIFLTVTEYGGDRIQFSFFGAFIFVLLSSFLLLKDQFNRFVQLAIVGVFVILCLLWNTYLYNMFLSDGWVFT